ncbi:MAG: DnaJ domain-containing protein [Magnetococcales bacterium]|nr:DnaJ domain-containing protein [Magnetococcales bacterium]
MTNPKQEPIPPTMDDLSDEAGLYQRLTWAREVLGLGETATGGEIEESAKRLLKQWHPDRVGGHARAHQKFTRQIVEAKAILDGYCAQYRFSFSREESKKYLSPQEWFWQRFGQV